MIAHLALAVVITANGGWTPPPEPPPAIPVEELADSVHTYDLQYSVLTLDTSEIRDGKTVISLSSDILFDVDRSNLPASSGEQIVKLLADVPQGADLAIGGHTDSVKGAVPLQKLSKDRAEAVAKVVKKQRPDLKLAIKGLADTEPVAIEDPADPSTRAKNRRVELVYKG